MKALDKAGNEQKQTIGFSVAKPLIWKDTDIWIDDGTPSNPSQPDGLPGTPPAGSGGSGGTASYGWGVDGRWGYWSGGSWYGSPYTTPEQLIGTPWLPSAGTLDNRRLTSYRGRLQEILKTAIAVMPNTTAESQSKRAALKNRMTLLIEAGAYLNGGSDDSSYYGYEGNNFNVGYWQDRFFKGSLRAAQEWSVDTIALGVQLAKDLLDPSSDSVRLQTFETLVETAIGAAHLETNWSSPSYPSEIRDVARELAKSYGLLKPQGNILTGNFAWLDKLWDLAENPSKDDVGIRKILCDNKRYQAGGIIGEVVRAMNGLGQSGDGDDLQLLQMSDRLLKAASSIGSWQSDLETTEFTQALLNFGYEVIKVRPTVDSTNATEVSSWVETLLEDGDRRMAAAGLSDFLSGVQLRADRIKTLEYADRNMCTLGFLLGLAMRDASFVIREHQSWPWTALSELKPVGFVESGELFEQLTRIEQFGDDLLVRWIVLRLSKSTRHEEKEIVFLTNLPIEVAGAEIVLQLYREHWGKLKPYF